MRMADAMLRLRRWSAVALVACATLAGRVAPGPSTMCTNTAVCPAWPMVVPVLTEQVANQPDCQWHACHTVLWP